VTLASTALSLTDSISEYASEPALVLQKAADAQTLVEIQRGMPPPLGDVEQRPGRLHAE